MVCNGNLLCYHDVVERNCISSLQSHGKPLEKECCLPGVFRDSGDTPANLNGRLVLLLLCPTFFYRRYSIDVLWWMFYPADIFSDGWTD